jgi:hypothetical protein
MVRLNGKDAFAVLGMATPTLYAAASRDFLVAGASFRLARPPQGARPQFALNRGGPNDIIALSMIHYAYSYIEGVRRPYIACRSCGQPITDASSACVIYSTGTPGTLDGTGDVMAAHDGKCADDMQQLLGENLEGRDSLAAFLAQLMATVSLKPSLP